MHAFLNILLFILHTRALTGAIGSIIQWVQLTENKKPIANLLYYIMGGCISFFILSLIHF